MTPQASAAPVQRNENTMPMSARNDADQAPAPERHQQQIAGHHRRQHQRQMHDAVEQRLAPEILAREQPGDGEPNGSATKVATSAMRSDSSTAVHSSGVRLNTADYGPAFTR